ncbi:MAG: TetR/AcrR family transcriptional regulator, partial [Nonomuraea sp.]|nr:TetR/AcrR family transcriptional regulator [Nonomuraea sp.]
MTKGDDVKEEPVRQRLLGAATRLFAARGFESTSVQEIVVAAGVTKGAMYHYFDSKDDLLHEIYARLLRMQMDRLTRIADGPGALRERLHRAAADVVETTTANLDDSKIFFRSMHLLATEKQKTVR